MTRLATERGQSEVVGTVLLTAVVVAAATVAGTAALGDLRASATDAPLVDCRVDSAPGALRVVHAGGDRVRTARLEVVLENGSGRTRSSLSVDTGDGDARFDPGEAAVRPPVAAPTRVLVVTDRAAVCRATVSPP